MTGAGNWTWLLPGRVPTLIDAGTGAPEFIDDLHAALAGSSLAQVLVTHGHIDHASGAPALHALMPTARFRKMPWPERDARWPAGWEPLADGDAIAAGDTSLTAVHTPGHAPDHLCFWHEETRSLFCGDLAVRGTTVYIPTTLQGDLSAYLASLERILALNPARMYPAHGPVIDEPSKLLEQYLEHRREREGQVLDALGAGVGTAEAMVARIYPRLSDALLPVARETMLAHLLKLERDGRVVRDGDDWRLV
jgi:glyoxylase-like metal-dependent hydrolase (beta-lactamase superfamily II)